MSSRAGSATSSASGFGYLTLERQARTLSGGEAQRATLTAALGTSLHNALFVLDEPTVGLHPTDVAPLIEAMRELSRRKQRGARGRARSLVIRGADRVVELGPGAGSAGGSIVASTVRLDVSLDRRPQPGARSAKRRRAVTPA